MTTPVLTIRQLLDQPAVVPLWPTVGQALGLAQSTTYQLAAENRLPIEVIRLGRRRVARLIDLHRFLGLLPEENTDGAEESCQATSTPPNESPLTSAN